MNGKKWQEKANPIKKSSKIWILVIWWAFKDFGIFRILLFWGCEDYSRGFEDVGKGFEDFGRGFEDFDGGFEDFCWNWKTKNR